MGKSLNWCPNCEMETDWLIVPSAPSTAQCKNCGHRKTIPGLRVKKPKLKRTSAKEKPTIPGQKSLFEMSGKELRTFIDGNIRVADVCSSSSSTLEISRILLSNPADRAMMFLLQALVHQNKAIIAQNELIHRLLSKKPGSKAQKTPTR